MDGYASTEIALSCGSMLREVIRVPRLHKLLLYGPDGGLSKPVCDLFEYHVNNPNFEVRVVVRPARAQRPRGNMAAGRSGARDRCAQAPRCGRVWLGVAA